MWYSLGMSSTNPPPRRGINTKGKLFKAVSGTGVVSRNWSTRVTIEGKRVTFNLGENHAIAKGLDRSLREFLRAGHSIAEAHAMLAASLKSPSTPPPGRHGPVTSRSHDVTGRASFDLTEWKLVNPSSLPPSPPTPKPRPPANPLKDADQWLTDEWAKEDATTALRNGRWRCPALPTSWCPVVHSALALTLYCEYVLDMPPLGTRPEDAADAVQALRTIVVGLMRSPSLSPAHDRVLWAELPEAAAEAFRCTSILVRADQPAGLPPRETALIRLRQTLFTGHARLRRQAQADGTT